MYLILLYHDNYKILVYSVHLRIQYIHHEYSKGRIKQHDRDYSFLVCTLARALDLGHSFTSPESSSYFNGYFIVCFKVYLHS